MVEKTQIAALNSYSSDLEHVIIHMGLVHLLNSYLNPGAEVTKMNQI